PNADADAGEQPNHEVADTPQIERLCRDDMRCGDAARWAFGERLVHLGRASEQRRPFRGLDDAVLTPKCDRAARDFDIPPGVLGEEPPHPGGEYRAQRRRLTGPDRVTPGQFRTPSRIA